MNYIKDIFFTVNVNMNKLKKIVESAILKNINHL